MQKSGSQLAAAVPHASKAAKIDLHGLPVEVAKVAVQVRWLGDGEPCEPSSRYKM